LKLFFLKNNPELAIYAFDCFIRKSKGVFMNVGLQCWDYVAMIVYLVAVIALGFKFSKNEDSSEDYLLGGRKIPWYAVGISCLMSLLSTYSLVMVPGEIFNHGLSMWSLGFLAPFVQIPAFLIFVRFYFKLNSFTPFEYLERRYDSKVRALIATIYTYSRLIYLAMVLFATSKVFEGAAGWPAWVTILLVGVIGIVYTVMGGMLAVVWTDVLQFFVLIGGLGIAIVVLCINVDGGFFGAITYTFEHGHGLSKYSDPNFYLCNPYVRLTFWLLLIGTFMAPLKGAASDQITIQRLLSTNSYKSAFKAQLTSSILSIPFMMILLFIGMGIFSYYSQHPDPRVTSGDTAFFTFVATKLPSPVPGLIMAAMLAAVMSTLDSGMNSLSAIWLKEFHVPYVKSDLTGKQEVKISRYATLFIGIFSVSLAMFIAKSSDALGQSVVEATVILGGFDVIVFPAFLFAVISSRANKVMIWILASLLWGIQFGQITWYTITAYVAKNWVQGQPLGLGGPISFTWVAIPLSCFAVIFIAWLLARYKTKKLCLPLLGAALAPLGYSTGLALWYFYSNNTEITKPAVLSFQWVAFPAIISFIVIGGILLLFSKKQPIEKYMGLTLSTCNADLID
jgi:SSS family transporter